MGIKKFNNLESFQVAVKNASAGDTIVLEAGEYFGNTDLDYRKAGEITVIMHGVKINGEPDNKKQKYALDIKGNNITVLADGLKLIGGNSGVLGVRGNNLKIVSDLKGYITGHNRGCLEMGQNHHIQGLNFDGLGAVGISGQGFPIQDNMNRTYGQSFGWFDSNNWRITQCVFQNIQPPESGDAGGGFRIIPHAKDVMVDNCIFRNIRGSGLWGDHNQKGFQWYYNTFENIQTADAFGKAMFLEIMDADPNDKSGFVAKIAGNTFINCETQTILIAASSGQNPAGIDVFGNIIYDGWGITCGAMQRQFKRKWDAKDRSKDEPVDARLENIRIRKNVIKQTTGRNHISIFQGKRSGRVEVDSNYYVAGHKYEYTRPNGVTESELVTGPKIHQSESDADGLFIHGEANGLSLDKNAISGAFPTEFPFPEIYAEIPVERVDISTGTVIDIPDPVIIDDPVIDIPDPVIDDPVIDDPIIDDLPVYDNDLPRVVITTDFSDGESDWDDWEALAISAMYQDYVNIEKVVIASAKQKNSGALEAYNRVFKPAYAQVVEALNESIDDYWRDSLDVIEASSNGEGFTGQSIDLDKYPSTKAIIDLIRDDDVLNVLWWGTGGECANVAKWLEENAPEKMENVRFISHAASLPTHNNYKKDKAAAQYMEYIGEAFGNYYSAGFSGKVIDGRHSFPLVKIDDHGTDLGKITHYKHTQIKSGPKTDGSDAIIFFILVSLFGGGESYLNELDSTGKSNEAKIKADFENLRPDMFPDISTRFKMVADYDGEIVIDDPVINEPDPIDDGLTNDELKAKISFMIDFMQELYEEL